MITIETLIKTDHKIKLKEGERTYSRTEILGKSYATALEAISELVPEFNTITFYVTQDNDSATSLSDNLVWREREDHFEVYDLEPTKEALKMKTITASYYLYDPESSSKEKILVSLN